MNPETLTHILKAREFEESGHIESAIDEIRLALFHRPSASRILRKLGLLHFEIGKTAIGIKCLQKAISVNKQDTISRDHLARVYLKQKEYRKAAKIYTQILGLSTRYFTPAVRLGKTLLIKGYRPEAIGLFSKVISRSRRNNSLRDEIIDICLENHESEFALTIMENTLKENPSNHDFMYKTGMIYLENGDYERAMSNFSAIDSGKKGDIHAKLQIARIYQLNGRILQADDYVRQVLRLDPGNAEALALRQEL